MKDIGKLASIRRDSGKNTIHNKVHLQPSLGALIDVKVYKWRDPLVRYHSIYNKLHRFKVHLTKGTRAKGNNHVTRMV